MLCLLFVFSFVVTFLGFGDCAPFTNVIRTKENRSCTTSEGLEKEIEC